MIKKEDIANILDGIKKDHPSVSEKDIVFLVLCDTFADADFAFRMAYGRASTNIASWQRDALILDLKKSLEPYGVGVIGQYDISREENKAELVKLLKDIEKAEEEKKIESKDALKMKLDIRVKLQDKFDMEGTEGQRRIIINPSRHDIICPHTNRECTFMPTKSACMEYWNLKE